MVLVSDASHMSQNEKAAIKQLKNRYCHLIDDGDYRGWVETFTSDGRFIRGNGDTFKGRDEIYRFASTEFDTTYSQTAHIVTNPVIELDGKSASGRWHLLLLYERSNGDIGWTQAVYEDEYQKKENQWYIHKVALTYGVASDY